MTKKKITFETNRKIINNLVRNGKKSKSEQIFLKTLKALQKNSKKTSKKLLQFALISHTPFFRIHQFVKKKKKNKKKIKMLPVYIKHKNSKISFAIKFIVETTLKKEKLSFFQKLFREILSFNKTNMTHIEIKKEKYVFLNKSFFKYYRWN